LQTPEQRVDALFALFHDRGGADYIGEPISQVEQAKEVGIPMPDLDRYLDMAFHLITRGN
jgi:hypothetical protein